MKKPGVCGFSMQGWASSGMPLGWMCLILLFGHYYNMNSREGLFSFFFFFLLRGLVV